MGQSDEKILRSYYEDIYRTIRKFIGEREYTAQEAALDAIRKALIEFSREQICVQARRPRDTIHTVRRGPDRAKRKREGEPTTFQDLVYDTHVLKYINSTY